MPFDGQTIADQVGSMSVEQAKWIIVQEYDKDWPDDLRSAGHHAKAFWLEVVIGRLVRGESFSPTEDCLTMELADFMSACAAQRDGS